MVDALSALRSYQILVVIFVFVLVFVLCSRCCYCGSYSDLLSLLLCVSDNCWFMLCFAWVLCIASSVCIGTSVRVFTCVLWLFVVVVVDVFVCVRFAHTAGWSTMFAFFLAVAPIHRHAPSATVHTTTELPDTAPTANLREGKGEGRRGRREEENRGYEGSVSEVKCENGRPGGGGGE